MDDWGRTKGLGGQVVYKRHLVYIDIYSARTMKRDGEKIVLGPHGYGWQIVKDDGISS